MGHAGYHQNPTSEYQKDVNYNFQHPPTQETIEQTTSQTHLSQNPSAKRPFDRFKKIWPKSLFYFAQNPATVDFIDRADVEKMVYATETLENRRFYTRFIVIAINFVTVAFLNQRNKIIALTSRVSFWGVAAKYIIIPDIVTVLLSQMFYHPAYDRVANPIKSKYSFQDPIFREEYDKDPHPEVMISQFYERHLGKKYVVM